MKTIKIKELNIEVTYLEEWTEPYNKIKVPKGWKLIEIWQLAYILESKYCNEFLGKFKGKYSLFWCSQTKFAKDNGYSCGVNRGWSGSWDADWDGLVGSGGDGRVAFVREMK